MAPLIVCRWFDAVLLCGLRKLDCRQRVRFPMARRRFIYPPSPDPVRNREELFMQQKLPPSSFVLRCRM